ncbi:hypothetical protein [Neorhizobium lilium]|uniref:hypothetical protein n=1 Tax=Neorhizobium lilium TaxID=2503024 RepID=UPI00197D542B|nr:hypothetical protein [Neorhizobium lilium]
MSALFVLPGCFEMQQDIIVGDDGTSKLRWEMSVDAALIGMASQGKADTFCAELGPGKMPEGFTGSAQRSTEKGDVVCTISVEGPTEKIFAALAKGNLLSGDSGKQSGQLAMKLTDEGDNKRLELAIPPMPKKAGDDERMQAMLLGATSGRVLEWTITAPQIIETTGKLSEDGKTATYSLPVASMLTNKTETFGFSVVFSDKPAGMVDWVKSLFK